MAQQRVNDGENNSPWFEGEPVAVLSMMQYSIPADGASDVVRRNDIVVRFRWTVNQGSAEAHYVLTHGGDPVPGTFIWQKAYLRLLFRPTEPLAANTQYVATLSPGIERRSTSSMGWGESFSFTTGGEPVVVERSPVGEGQPTSSVIQATFDQPMNTALTAANIVLIPSLNGTFSWPNNRTVRFTPSAPLASDRNYRIEVRPLAEAATGVAFLKTYAWTFRTAPAGALAVSAASAGGSDGACAISVTLSSPARVQVAISNLAGRHVAIIPERACPAGTTTLLWSGRTHAGARAPSGRYLMTIRASQGNVRAVCIVPLLR